MNIWIILELSKEIENIFHMHYWLLYTIGLCEVR